MKEKKTFRSIPGLSREEEEKQLADILTIAQGNLKHTREQIRSLSEEVYDLMETYGPKDKEALSLLRNTQAQLEDTKRNLVRCEKARKKPYFGRIDFRDQKLPQEESYYVGRVGISDKDSEPVVIDWRAPVASIYYENSTGLCQYEVKNHGSYEVDLKRKRTYEIENDQLKDFFDSDVVANDELLTKYLAKSKKAVLGEIIATIQQEQNAIIRTSPKTNIIVQGVAGSGKTTVAMHRISYILYNYEDKFRPEDFYIIGSNRILLNYITSVLPDLDVYGVSQMTMEQLFVRFLYEDWDPRFHRIKALDAKDKEAWVKGSYDWFHELEAFCEEYEERTIPSEEIRIEKNGVLLMDENVIRTYRKDNPTVSVQGKIDMLNEMLHARLENELTGKFVSYTDEEKKELQRLYRWHFGKKEWKGSIFEVYQEFLEVQKERGKKVPFTENEFDLYDLAALAYLYKRIKENDGIREASHVIIDEAQDFGMMAYGVLAYCLRGCTYTIMGDVSQNIHFGYGLNDWKDLQELILTGPFDSFGLLKKSYRNTVEISDFATEILRHGNFPIYPVEPVIRHGNAVEICDCVNEKAMLEKTVELIRKWQQAGHETIAVICRDEEETKEVDARLGEKITLVNSDLTTAEFGSGVMVLPVEYTKGLEFDAVLLYHPSEEHYPSEDAYVKLLYVAATRALHELAVVHTGDLTDLIGTKVSEEKRLHSLENQVHKESQALRKKPAPVEKKAADPATEKVSTAEERGLLVKAAHRTEEKVEISGGMKVSEAGKEKALSSYSRPMKLGFVGEQPAPPKLNLPKNGQPPKREVPVRKALESKVRTTAPINPSSYPFGGIPNSSVLRPKGHSRIDTAVRILRKTKKYLEIISNYGILHLIPLEDGLIRVQFQKGIRAEFEAGYWDYQPESPVKWSAREGKGLAELTTEKLTVRIDKKTGALTFLDKTGKCLLAEKAALPRQMEYSSVAEGWLYFDWPKKEKLYAKGVLDSKLEPMNQKARYISFGQKALRMPLVVSEYGYGIGLASEGTALACTIPMYGSYLYMEGKQLDYYFIYEGNYERVLEKYKNHWGRGKVTLV